MAAEPEPGSSATLENLLHKIQTTENKLKILVTGKAGQGKSTLINGIFGTEVAVEGARAVEEVYTGVVKEYNQTFHDVPVTVFESPGLKDGTAKDIKGIRDQCKELSLVLYCTKMINQRLSNDDKRAMEKLNKAFGEKFWEYAVFVLTFANMENCERKDERDTDMREPALDDDDGWKEFIKKRFQGRLNVWKNDLKEFLINEVGVSPKIAETIPVVPTGDYKESRANRYPFHLPDRDDWSNEFWKVCLLHLKETQLSLEKDSDEADIADFEEEEIATQEPKKNNKKKPKKPDRRQLLSHEQKRGDSYGQKGGDSYGQRGEDSHGQWGNDLYGQSKESHGQREGDLHRKREGDSYQSYGQRGGDLHTQKGVWLDDNPCCCRCVIL